jgi:hypothetical protein
MNNNNIHHHLGLRLQWSERNWKSHFAIPLINWTERSLIKCSASLRSMKRKGGADEL